MKVDDQAPDGEPTPSLIRAVLAGDADALDRWYRAEFRIVWRLCLGLLADRAEADDLAQDAMLKLHDRLDRWDPARPFPAWRTTIVVNLCRDRLRRTEARRRAEAAAAAEARLPDELPDPASAFEQAEVRAALQAALARLSDREREAFVLRELEGLSMRGVAGLLGIGESSVRSLLSLARRRLRRLLGERIVGSAPEGGRHA